VVKLAVELSEAESHLSELIAKLGSGTEILITRHGLPLARLVPAADGTPRADRVPGSAKGLFRVPDDFDAPLEDFREYT
jgi:prevent-host-death family protein